MPRPAKNRETVRLTLAINPEVRERLENLRDDTGADSLTEVIRRSLAVYEFIWENTCDGKKILLEDEDGTHTPVHLVWA